MKAWVAAVAKPRRRLSGIVSIPMPHWPALTYSAVHQQAIDWPSCTQNPKPGFLKSAIEFQQEPISASTSAKLPSAPSSSKLAPISLIANPAGRRARSLSTRLAGWSSRKRTRSFRWRL